MPHMFMRVTALINIEIWLLSPMNYASRWSLLGRWWQVAAVVVVAVAATTT